MKRIILTKQDVINTYNKKQQERSRIYLKYKRIKKENPQFGYKRISRLIGQPYHKTRWWHSRGFIPSLLHTVAWLEKRTNSLDLGMVARKSLLQNRIQFINKIQRYLKEKSLKFILDKEPIERWS